MIKKKTKLWTAGEYEYPADGGFIPFVMAYLHEEDESIRPAVLVVPGGAYRVVAPSEAQIVAERFYSMGYQAFVVVYTTNAAMNCPLKLQPLKDLSRAVVWVRQQAAALHVDPKCVAVCGFSAGGHLSASLSVHFGLDALRETEQYMGISNRPDLAILSYPVISSGKYAHKESFIALLGEDASEEEMEEMSLEKQVTADTPPSFVWTTFTDETVPCENSFLYAAACRQKGVSAELHVFRSGSHGMSLADDTWAFRGMEELYSLEQILTAIQYRIDHEQPIVLSPEQSIKLPNGTDASIVVKQLLWNSKESLVPDAAIAKWPDLADAWIKRMAEGF